jgi:hypothetical protein
MLFGGLLRLDHLVDVVLLSVQELLPPHVHVLLLFSLELTDGLLHAFPPSLLDLSQLILYWPLSCIDPLLIGLYLLLKDLQVYIDPLVDLIKGLTVCLLVQ